VLAIVRIFDDVDRLWPGIDLSDFIAQGQVDRRHPHLIFVEGGDGQPPSGDLFEDDVAGEDRHEVKMIT